MGNVTVQYVGLVRSLIGVRTETVELPIGARVSTLLRALWAKYGEKLGYYVLTDEFNISGLARILIDEVDLTDLADAEETVIEDGSRVVIMSMAPLSGG